MKPVLLGEQQYVPDSIKTYIGLGIDSLVIKCGEEVLVTVTGHGHVCNGTDYEVTSATVEVRVAQ